MDPIQLPHPIDVEQRRTRVAHVEAGNHLDGLHMSDYMSSKMADYAKGLISAADLVAAARSRYIIAERVPTHPQPGTHEIDG